MSFSSFCGFYLIGLALLFLYSGDMCLTFTCGAFGFVMLRIHLKGRSVTSMSDYEIIEKAVKPRSRWR